MDDRVEPIGRAEALPDPDSIEPVIVDLAEGSAAAELVIAAARLRQARRGDRDRTAGPMRTVLPLVAVNGRAVDLGEGRAIVRVPEGPALVEAMDDFHYDSRTVDVRAGETAELWIGASELRHENRIRLGPRDYAAHTPIARRIPKVRAGLIGYGIAGLGFLLAARVVIDLNLNAVFMVPALLVPIAIAIGAYRTLLPAFERKLAGPSSAPAPEPVQGAVLLPADVDPPPGSGVCLRFEPEPRALSLIAIRFTEGTKSLPRPYRSNRFEDWLAAPEVTVNGRTLGARWGTWWIPLEPGRVRLKVRLPGFADPRRDDPNSIVPAWADIELELGDGPRFVDCRYNVVRLATDRVAMDSSTRSEWQCVLEDHGVLEDAVKRSTAPPLVLSP